MTFNVSCTGLWLLETTSMILPRFSLCIHLFIVFNVHFFRGLDVVRPATIAPSTKRPSSGSGSQVYQPLAPQLDTPTCTDYYVLMNPRDRAKSQVCCMNYLFHCFPLTSRNTLVYMYQRNLVTLLISLVNPTFQSVSTSLFSRVILSTLRRRSVMTLVG